MLKTALAHWLRSRCEGNLPGLIHRMQVLFSRAVRPCRRPCYINGTNFHNFLGIVTKGKMTFKETDLNTIIVATKLLVCGVIIILTADTLPRARCESSRTPYRHRHICTHAGNRWQCIWVWRPMVCDIPVILILSFDAV